MANESLIGSLLLALQLMDIKRIYNYFIINYNLKNTGEKNIITDEYVHNFTSINNDLIGHNYELKFPFQLKPKLFDENINPEHKVKIKNHHISFNGSHNKPFFFSNLSSNNKIEGSWKLINHANKIVISETTSFKTAKVNLWGCKHVISPELFFNINIKPGESTEWSRTYKMSLLK